MNRFRVSIFAFILLSLVVLSGCSAAGSGESAESGARKVATFEGGDVTQGELQQQVGAAVQQSGGARLQGGIEPGSEQFKQIASSIMPQVVGSEISLAYAREHDITVSDQKLQQQIDQIKQQIASRARTQGQNVSPEEGYQRALQQSNLTEGKARSLIRKQLLLQKVQEQVVGNVEVSDQEARKFYEQNKEQSFTQPKQVCVGRILFAPDQKKKAQEVKQKIESGEADFAKMAEENSQDPQSAEKGGDVGCVALQQFPEKVGEALSDAGKGDLVGPVETEFGYEVVRVKDVKPQQSTPYEEVSSQIKDRLSQQKQSEKFQEWVQKQMERRNVEYLPGYEPQQSGGGQPSGQ